jgi:hypothetical protein
MALPGDSAPRFLPRDRDAQYAAEFQCRVKGVQIEEAVTADETNQQQSQFVSRIQPVPLDKLSFAPLQFRFPLLSPIRAQAARHDQADET